MRSASCRDVKKPGSTGARISSHGLFTAAVVGHRIPAWFDEDGNTASRRERKGAAQVVVKHCAVKRTCSTLVLVGAVAFATTRLAAQTPDLERHYPKDVIIAGVDYCYSGRADLRCRALSSGPAAVESPIFTGVATRTTENVK